MRLQAHGADQALGRAVLELAGARRATVLEVQAGPSKAPHSAGAGCTQEDQGLEGLVRRSHSQGVLEQGPGPIRGTR